ncbi:LysR family transcriptional regulator [Desnuesiella massiliensis]|uniref:LysR family transcriptional regulator n=1 Tax=Desnuesiella massiliensis TaxID=1650662 RepID=UPI0006E2B0D9|nr:LysR family transcriptional regulator [Desnuesiella massiliensis]
MNLELYKFFYHVAKASNVSKASEQLYVTQPAVSRAIKQLEDELGCQLFFRTSKGVKLTQEGEVLFQYIEQAFNFISSGEKKVSDIKSLLTGEVKIGASETLCKYYLAPFLKLFKTYYPSIKVVVTCPNTHEIVRLIKAGEIDFGLVNMPLKDEQLEFKHIMDIQDCFIVGQKYKHLSGTKRHIKDIASYPMLLLEKASNTRMYIDQYFEKNSIMVTPDFEFPNIDLLIHFSKYDFGIACVIENFVEDILENNTLYKINLIEKIPPRSMSAAWLKNIPLTAAAKELIKYLEYNPPYEF